MGYFFLISFLASSLLLCRKAIGLYPAILFKIYIRHKRFFSRVHRWSFKYRNHVTCKEGHLDFFPSWFIYFCLLCFSITTAKIQALYWARAMRVRLCLKPDFGWDTSIASSIEYNVGLRVDIRGLYCAGVCCYNQILDIRWLIKKSGG